MPIYVVDLLRLIKEKTNLFNFTLKNGYPLKNLDISLDARSSQSETSN